MQLRSCFATTYFLEAVNMVTEFGPAKQASVCHIVQVAKGRRLVYSAFTQSCRNLSMSHRRVRIT